LAFDQPEGVCAKKIEAAVELHDAGIPFRIVSEQHWKLALV
jgi:hypothetical protein